MCTVVLGDDIITRQGMLMMDDLKMQILEAIKECQIPKVNKNIYQVYIFSFLHLWKKASLFESNNFKSVSKAEQVLQC